MKTHNQGGPRRARGGLCALVLAAACAVVLPWHPATAADSAVIFMYHRFGETTHPSTNIRLDQFEAQIAEAISGGYNIMKLPDIVAALGAGRDLPDRTIGFSIDDAFLSVYTEAWPRLKKAGIPFTLFVATDPVDRAEKTYMNWDQIRELVKDGVTIGSQTATHLHMAASSAKRNAADLAKSNQRFQAELGLVPKLIAYPFGEYSLAVRKVTRAAGFSAGFGQHSGVLHAGADFDFLPRFAMNEAYGEISRFRLAARALPLPVSDLVPADPLLSSANNPPPFGFTVSGAAVKSLLRLACYAAGQGKLRVERLGESRIEVRTFKPFRAGRARINCTMPAKGNRWRWFGMQFYVPKP